MHTDATEVKARWHADLRDLSLDAVPSYGGKAARLGVLLQAGVRVPEGVALSSIFFGAFLEHNRCPTRPAEWVSRNDEIRQLLLRGSFPPDAQVLLREIHRMLTADARGRRLAVRSSASCEDRRAHSMAGVFESSVGVETVQDLEVAIRRTYASLFSDHALAFVLKEKIALDGLTMGVLVQQFVPGAPSGVMFTADAVAMDPDVVVVNAVDGPCAACVDGSLPSTLYKVDKHDGTVLERHAASSTTHLPAEALAQLRQAGDRIERVVGEHQDVEWTFSGGELWILQARPITTFTRRTQELLWPDLGAEGKTWRLDRNCPNPLLPLQQSITVQVYQGVHQGMMVTGNGRGFEGRFVHGHAYIHPQAGRASRRREAYAAKLAAMRGAGNDGFCDDVLPQILSYTRVLGEYLHRSLDNRELAEFLDLAVEFHGRGREFHAIAIAGDGYLPAFAADCQERCPTLTVQDVYDLVHGVSWLARDREAVLRMAGHVNAHPALRELFRTQRHDELLFARLERSAEGRELARQVRAYLEDFGLFPQPGGGARIAPPVLLENPAVVLSKIRGCLEVDAESVFRSQAAISARREKVLAAVLAVLPEAEHPAFRLRLRAAEKAFLAEDDHCYHLDLCSEGYSRVAILKAGERLAGDGVIAAADDVWFLTLDEIDRALTVGMGGARRLIEERQALHQQQKLLAPPGTLGKAPESSPPRADHAPTDAGGEAGRVKRLTGVSGCRKGTRGVVKVCRAAFQTPDALEPCILVMPHGHGQYLLPLLGRIRGLICDEGSPFDHAGIIAREWEIPAVYQTGVATRILRDGDEVEIDGVRGEVRVLR